MNYKDFYKEINNKTLGSLYLFTGREMFIANSMLEQAIASVLDEGQREFNFVELKEDKLEFSEFYNALNTLPLFCDKKILVIRCEAIFNSALWSDADLKRLKSFFEKNAISDTIVFFISEKVDARNKFYKAIRSLGKIVQYDKINESELVAWISKQFALFRVKIEQKVIKAFAVHCGYLNSDFDIDLYHLQSDIKALAMEFQGSSISERVILSRYDNSQEANLFKAIDSIFEQSKDCYEKWNLLIDRGEPALKLLFMLHRHLRQLLGVKLSISLGKTQRQIEEEMNLKNFVAKKYISQSKRFELPRLYELLENAAKIDFAFKNLGVGAGEDVRMLQTLVYQIAGKEK